MVADIIPRLATEVVGIPGRVTAAEDIQLRVTVAVAAGIQPPAVAGHRMVEDRRRTAEAAEAARTADMGGKR